MKTFLKVCLLAGVVAFGVYLWNSEEPYEYQLPQEQVLEVSQEPNFGATIPVIVSLFESSLQSSISDSATSMTLVSGTDRAGNSLSGYMCFTIDEGTSVAEFVCGTASSTAVSSLTRGISPLTGTSTVASLKFSHRRGASVKVTNYPQLAIVSRILNGDETLPNLIKYDSSIATSTIAANLQALVNVDLLNSTAFNGSPDASATVKGISEAATAAELLAGTGTGSTGALLFAPASLFNATSSATTLVPVTKTNGKLSQSFLDLTENYTWTGVQTFSSATTTFSATTSIASSPSNKLFLNGVGYAFPSSQGSASTTLVNNGSGTLTWATLPITTMQATSSANTIAAANTERSTSSTSYIKIKEFEIEVGGIYRFTWDLKSSANGVTANGRIYRNGVAVGTEKSEANGTYASQTDDVSGWTAGDNAELYIKTQSGTVSVRNFTLNGVLIPTGTVTTD